MNSVEDYRKLYREEMLEEAGMNVKVNERIYLCDLLRIDFDYELRPEFVEDYLRQMLPSNFQLFNEIQKSIPLLSVSLLTSFSALISTQYIKVALNTSFSDFYSFYHTSEYPNSYLLISLSIELAYWNRSVPIEQILSTATEKQTILNLKSSLAGYIYSVSRISAKNLLLKYSEAKALFTIDPQVVSPEEIIENYEQLPIAKKKAEMKLAKEAEERRNVIVFEHTESFEYSNSAEDSGDEGKFQVKISEFGEQEVKTFESPWITSLESNRTKKTPIASPRMFGYPTERLRFVISLQEHQDDSFNKGNESEKTMNKTSCSETLRGKDEKNCYQCDYCISF